MNVATYAFLVSQGFTTEDIEKMENAVTGIESMGNNEGTEDVSNNEGTEDVAPENNDIAELTKTVKELSDTVKAMQSDNSKNAKGGKAEKKTSESVLKDFFTNV